MTTSNKPVFDILVTDGTPNGKLTNVGSAWATPKGTGYRFKLKAALPAGAQLLILPSRNRGEATVAPEVQIFTSASGDVALIA